jgi:hypothetical protein
MCHTSRLWNLGNVGGFTSFIAGNSVFVLRICVCWFISDTGRRLRGEMWGPRVHDTCRHKGM